MFTDPMKYNPAQNVVPPFNQHIRWRGTPARGAVVTGTSVPGMTSGSGSGMGNACDPRGKCSGPLYATLAAGQWRGIFEPEFANGKFRG